MTSGELPYFYCITIYIRMGNRADLYSPVLGYNILIE